MPRIQIYLPDDLYKEAKTRELPVSEMLQKAVRAEVRRRDLIKAGEEYLAELRQEVAESSAEERAWAEALVDRIEANQKPRAS